MSLKGGGTGCEGAEAILNHMRRYSADPGIYLTPPCRIPWLYGAFCRVGKGPGCDRLMTAGVPDLDEAAER